MPISKQDIEAELSYAYLHAIAAAAGLECCVDERIADKNGIDAQIRAYGEPRENGGLSDFAIAVQLKATYTDLSVVNDRISFGKLKVAQYDKLRNPHVQPDRFLVLLHLPAEREEWLRVSPTELIAKNCAYWVSLRNAPPSKNDDYQTVYIPKGNLLDVSGLRSIMARIGNEEVIDYAG